MEPLTLTTWLGSALLIILAAVPTKLTLRVSVAAMLVTIGIVVGALLIRSVPAHVGYVPSTDPSRLAKYGVNALAAALKRPKENLIVVEGGSYAVRGIEPDLLRKELDDLGYRADIVQLALGAANHFERYILFSDVLGHPKLKNLVQHPNLVLMAEVQRNYDQQPLDQLQENQDTRRAFHYISPVNAGYALWSLWAGGGEAVNLKHPLWTASRHALVNAFNVGLLDRVTPLKKIKSRQGYVAGGINGGYRFKGLAPVMKRASGPLIAEKTGPWIFSVREARLKKLWGKRLDHWVYYGVPSTRADQMTWLRSVCAETKVPCIAPSDMELLSDLDKKANWRDKGHVTSRGSVLYTKWLAKRLVETGTLEK